MEHKVHEFDLGSVVVEGSEKWYKFGDKAATAPNYVAPVPVKYGCPVCEELYGTPELAEACRDQPFNECGLELGAIVIIPNSYINSPSAEGFEHWCAFTISGDESSSDHFDHHDQRYPYYVVTALHQDRHNKHRCIATVITLITGHIWGGWNPSNGDGHYSMFFPGRSKVEQTSDVGSTWWEDERNGVTFSTRILRNQPSERLLEEAKQLADIRISAGNLL